MSNGHEPACDLACQTKIIIDGDLAGKVFESTCEGLLFFFNNGGKLHSGQRVLEALIVAEDAAFEFARIVNEETGHKGPWPKCLPAPQ